MEIKFFNTMERKVVPFKSIEDGVAKLYTCGPTVYNYAHIGNFRAYIFEDILHRTLKYFNYKVIQVMNLTDVDDKTIRDSRAAGLSLDEFTKKYKKSFFDDLKSLNILPAEVYPEATRHIKEMIDIISVLMDKGFAYQSEDKCIYFSIEKFPEYGKLAHIDRENQRSGVRIKNDEYAKDSVADFALWKAWDENDGDVYWESPWGKGRPGWHIECSAMATKYLGENFDLHTGGIDNMFPHHEDEIAQSEAANGKKWVNYWLHCAHLMVDGDKMSKSKGNFYTLRDLLEKGFSGREIRFVLLGVHYRKKLNFTIEGIEKARESLKKFDEFFRRINSSIKDNENSEELENLVSDIKTQFDTAIADDLNISGAIAALYDLMRKVNRFLDNNSISSQDALNILDLLRKFDIVLGCLNVDCALEKVEEEFPQEAIALAEARLKARKDKNYAESDRLRDELKALGFVAEDVVGGGYRLKKI